MIDALAPLDPIATTPRMPSPNATRVKPLLRGWLHLVAFFVALVAGGLLLVLTHSTRSGSTGALYVASLVTLFGVSTLYHRPNWSPKARRWVRRLDHSAIFFLVAGTYTPFSRALPRGPSAALLAIAWFGALSGSLVALFWPSAPKLVTAATYLLLGWMVVWFLPQIGQALGPVVIFWIVGGGLIYTLGALVYASRRPDPWPAVFGYHEIFHALVIAAATCHFVAVSVALQRLT